MDQLSIIGLLVGIGAVLLGQYLEGGHVTALLNGPALLIVMGGSLGAIFLQSPLSVFIRSMKLSSWIFTPPVEELNASIDRLIHWSNVARKEGLLGLETMIEQEPDYFVRKGMQLLVDGNEPEVIRDTLEIDLITREEADMDAARIYESMGAYTPTLGILGAVMGLIHVMGNLAEPEQLGSGIAVAFVATIYGVGFANLIFLPMANKLKAIIKKQSQFREMLVEGIVAIAEGENPRSMEGRLSGYLE